MVNKTDLHGKCPNCKVSWKGEEIPKDIREHYNPPYYWSRVIGIENPKIYDGVIYWMCPDCKRVWDRNTGELVDVKFET